MAAPQVAFIPLRGKLGIFEKLFVDTDFYLFGGVAFIGLEERANVDKGKFDMCKSRRRRLHWPRRSAASKRRRATTRAHRARPMAPTFGAGLSLFMADFLAMTIEWRAMPFSWNTSGTDESGDSER